MSGQFDQRSEPVRYLHELSAEDAKRHFLLSESYFDMDLPPYFNFNPILEFSCNEAGMLGAKKISSWKPDECSDVNYSLLHNKDGEIAWRPFELINPLIYGICVHTVTMPENWKIITDRFSSFRAGIVECCSMPVVADGDKKPTKEQILNWWKRVEQRSLELSLEYSHVRLTDVSNCYPSIYSHAIAWAIHGRDYLKDKNRRRDLELLGNKLDKMIRNSREGQTNGIPQASMLSHILAELVLGYCDTIINEALPDNGDLKILRYRDDYRIFGSSDSDCQRALKVISEKLHIFGMKLGAVKTSGAVNVISGSVKGDKLDALSLVVKQTTLQKEVLLIHKFAQGHPGSGATKFLLGQFLKRLTWRVKKGRMENENITVLTSILMDLAATSPHVFPAVASAISNLLVALNGDQKEELFGLILKRTARIPNSGYMETWLQRIALPDKLSFKSDELMCDQISGDRKCLWNYSWVQDKGLRTALETYSVVTTWRLTNCPTR